MNEASVPDTRNCACPQVTRYSWWKMDTDISKAFLLVFVDDTIQRACTMQTMQQLMALLCLPHMNPEHK